VLTIENDPLMRDKPGDMRSARRQEFNALVEEHQRVKADLTESLNKAHMRNAALEGLSKDLELVCSKKHSQRNNCDGRVVPSRQAASPRLCRR
jgi:hypothetical protein